MNKGCRIKSTNAAVNYKNATDLLIGKHSLELILPNDRQIHSDSSDSMIELKEDGHN